MRLLRSKLLICLFFLAGSAVALDPSKTLSEYVHVSWSVDTGLPQSTVRAVSQTRDGYLWLATHEGLIRFDGRQFFTFSEANTPALAGSGISALLSAAEGGLWIGLRDGGVVRYMDGKFKPLASQGGIPMGAITNLREDAANGLWIGSSSGGIGYVHQRDNKRNAVFTTAEGLPHNTVLAIQVLSDNSVYIGTSRGLVIFNNGKLTSENLQADFVSNPINAIHQDVRGRLWIGVAKKGIYVRENAAGDWGVYARDTGISDQITRLLVDRDDTVWIGSLDGLQRIRNRAVETMSAKAGLSSNYVRDLFEDAEGNIWVGTEGGLDRYRDGLISMWEVGRGLTEEFSRAVMEDRRGNIWVATSNGLFRFNANGTVVKRFDRADGLVSAAALSLVETTDGTIWVGTNAGGLHYLQGERWVNVGQTAGLESVPVRVLLSSQSGHLWVGTATGLLRIAAQGRGNADIFGPNNGLKNGQILALYEDPKGNVWVGTRAGLSQFRDDKFVRVGQESGINSAVFSIVSDGDVLLLATGKGLIAYDNNNNNKTTIINESVGLPSRVYFRIVDDQGANYWMCSNQGIVRLPKKQLSAVLGGSATNLTAQLFDRTDGMTTTQCNGGTQPAGWRTRDGRILFPTARGVAVYDPSRTVAANRRPPPVYMTSIVVNNEILTASDRVSLAPGRQRVEFRFVGLSFVEAERVRYRYRMEGFDKDWIDAGREQRATYTNLPAGQYRFQVIAANNDGLWNEDGASVVVQQRAPFYETVAFRFVFAFFVIMVLIGAYLTRTRALAFQSRRLQHLVDARTLDLESQKNALEVANQDKAALLDRLQEQSEAFEKLAKEDPLTGLANRREFDRVLTREWQRIARSGAPLAVIIADIDHFKMVNDQYNHAIGDEVIRKYAQLLNTERRSLDVVARYGGEEFVLLLPETNAQGARQIADRLRERIAEFDWSSIAPGLRLTSSFGVAERSEVPADANAERLVLAADTKLYLAKERGRNCVVG